MNAHFLAMASVAGMTSAIMNPLHQGRNGVELLHANVLNGSDPDCARWLRDQST